MKTIYQAMAAIMAEIPAIGKDSENKGQSFKYRGIDAVYNALHPLLAKHGVFVTGEVVEVEREERTNSKNTILMFSKIKMRYHFHSEDGSSVAAEAYGEGMDAGDKASNKAMAVAHKYALLQAFCIPTEDMPDPDAESHEVTAKSVISHDQLAELRLLAEEVGANVPAFCQWLKVRSMADIHPSQFQTAYAALEAKKRKVA